MPRENVAVAIALIIFALTYVLIAARSLSLLRIGRPAGALVGAVAMVVFGVLAPAEAYAFVDLRTIVLLFSMMVISGYLQEAGFFGVLGRATLRGAATPERLLGSVVWVAGIASAFLMNDTVCLMLTPIVGALTVTLGLEPLPFLLALATSANIGSVATLAGNPQNMLIGTASLIPYRDYLAVMGPVALLCLAANHGLLHLVFRKGLRRRKGTGDDLAPKVIRRGLMIRSMTALLGVVAAWMLGADLAFAALAGAAFLILSTRLSPRRVFHRLDWSLLVFFGALFVVVGGVEKVGAVAVLRDYLPAGTKMSGLAGFSFLSVLGSNLFSNVPFVLVAGKWVSGMPEARLHWYLLALTSTFAGNLTLVGSMANLIVAQLSRDVHVMGFREYTRYGILITAVTTVLGVAYLVAVFAW